MRYDLSPQIDYSKMTEEEFLDFLDAESKRIREQNYTASLSNYYTKYAKVGTENENKLSNQ